MASTLSMSSISNSARFGLQSKRVQAKRNAKFVVRASGSATVGEGKGGLEMVTLKGEDGSVAEVYPFGGVVTSWVKDGRDVLYVRPDAKFDKSKPISGGIPHCWPQFGPGDMQVHGFARNVDWTVTDTHGATVEMTLLPSEYTKAMWDHEFKVTQTITLEMGHLIAFMEVTNTDDKEFDFTSSFHTYFPVESLADVAVEGLDGLNMLDRVADEKKKQEGSVTIASEVDSVYFHAPSELTLKQGGGKEIKIASMGFPDAVVWNPWTTMEACYEEFVCVENAVVADPIVLAPGESWTGSMTLSV